MREVLDIMASGPVKVGSEQVFCDAVLDWLSVNFSGTIEAALEELAEMERRIEDGVPALRRLGGNEISCIPRITTNARTRTYTCTSCTNTPTHNVHAARLHGAVAWQSQYTR